jgi:hypothetical protein
MQTIIRSISTNIAPMASTCLRLVGMVWLLGAAAALQAQTNNSAVPPRCDTAQHAALDFWVGTWKGTWPNPQTGKPDSAVNTIVRSHDGCVVHESFRADAKGGLIGSSFSVYDRRRGVWRQTWVDNTGAYLDFVGGSLPEGLFFSREIELPDGTKNMQRMRFFNVTTNAFDWVWERSKDGGKTWETSWAIKYVREAR